MGKRLGVIALCCVVMKVAFSIIPEDEKILHRGDANNDGVVNVSDASYINNYLFFHGPPPPCMNQADANDDGQVTSTDSSFIVNWLFNGGPAPPAPGPYNTICAADGAPRPGCQTSPCP